MEKKPYAYIAWPKNKKYSFEKIMTIGEGVCLHRVTERPTQRQSNRQSAETLYLKLTARRKLNF